MTTPILFFVLGLVFGSVAGKGAWVVVAIPVVFGLLDLLFEGFDVASLIMILLSIALTIVGILLGRALLAPRLRETASES